MDLFLRCFSLLAEHHKLVCQNILNNIEFIIVLEKFISRKRNLLRLEEADCFSDISLQTSSSSYHTKALILMLASTLAITPTNSIPQKLLFLLFAIFFLFPGISIAQNKSRETTAFGIRETEKSSFREFSLLYIVLYVVRCNSFT